MNDSRVDAATTETQSRAAPFRVLGALLPMAMALYGSFQGIQTILVPARVEALDPLHKVADVALMTMICAGTGVAGLVLGGAASDATRSRWGRRAPWLAGMGVAAVILGLGLAAQRTLAGVALLYGALWFALNFFQAVMLAVTPDRIPPRWRSLASSVVAIAGPLGGLIGVNLAALSTTFAGHAGLAAALAATTAAFVVFAREPPWLGAGAAKPRPSRRPRLSFGLFKSFRSRDFALAYGFRVLMFTAQFSVFNYLLYILQDRVGAAALPDGDAKLAAGLFNSVRTLATLAAILVGGFVAERTHRRKIFAQVYALGMAGALLIPAFRADWPAMLAFAVLSGLAIGAYSTIDLTLMSKVLPDPDAAGRDIALLVMAGASAQFLAPPLGAALIAWGGYGNLFLAAALLTLAAGLAVSRIRIA